MTLDSNIIIIALAAAMAMTTLVVCALAWVVIDQRDEARQALAEMQEELCERRIEARERAEEAREFAADNAALRRMMNEGMRCHSCMEYITGANHRCTCWRTEVSYEAQTGGHEADAP